MGDTVWTIGSSPDCDVWIKASTVSGVHCRLRKSEGGFELEDLSSTNGTFVDGNRITAVTAVGPETVITLGSEVRFPWPDEDNAADLVSFGRGQENDFVIDAPGVSNRHGRIIVGARGTWVIKDLGSTNGIGIEVDGVVKPIRNTALISHSDTLMLGAHRVPVSDIKPLSQSGVALVTRAMPETDEAEFESSVFSNSPLDLVKRAHEPNGRSNDDSFNGGIRDKYGVSVLVGIASAALLFAAMVLMKGGSSAIPVSSEDISAPLASTQVTPTPAFASALPSAEAKSEKADPNQLIDNLQTQVVVPDVANIPPVKERTSKIDPSNLKPSDSVFWVTVGSQDESLWFRVGSASAIDRHTLVTSGTVIRAVKSLSDGDYPKVFVVHLSSGDRMLVSSNKLHPSLLETIKSAGKLRQEYQQQMATLQSPESNLVDGKVIDVKQKAAVRKTELVELGDRMLRAEASVIDYDVGWLSLADPLPDSVAVLEIAAKSAPRPMQKISLIGAPFDLQDPFFDTSMDREIVVRPFRVAGVLETLRGEGQRIFIDEEWDLGESNLFGSPLVDSKGRLIGVFSRHEITEPGKARIEVVGASVIKSGGEDTSR